MSLQYQEVQFIDYPSCPARTCSHNRFFGTSDLGLDAMHSEHAIKSEARMVLALNKHN